eukprot:TRINITY_DN4575_c0_g2_i1.p1 TRINITY_DN4575_c0_g2~~TRINITY_DN4575_c0_g2_i1.p1  ORF type:complete len:380 (-),score=153.02 TRINITY_DN4575_c0_g2_i1:469-1608(-)
MHIICMNTFRDIQKGAYIWEDIDSGVTFYWNQSEEKWIPENDEESKDNMDEDQNNTANEETKTASSDKTSTTTETTTTTSSGVGEEAKAEGADAEKDKKKKKKKKKKKPNTTVYVTGLPPDATEDELLEFGKKAGIVAKDPYTLENKVKIYRDEEGKAKGDGIITYLKEHSLPIAFQILDGSELRIGSGKPLSVTLAQFDKDKPEKPRIAQPKKKRKYNQELAELGWEETEQKHVIIKYLFNPEDAKNDPQFYLKLQSEIESEFEKMGDMESLKIFEGNPDGVVAVKYDSTAGAQKCIETMDGRWFDGRKLKAEYYDGFSDYGIAETEEEKEMRDKEWSKWLLGNDEFDELERREKRKQDKQETRKAKKAKTKGEDDDE